MERIKEMKTLLVAVNSQYVHSNLAVRYLKAACDEFLKLLRGSPLRRQAQQWGYRYRSYPPYEVISSRDLSWQEMIRLKDMEALLHFAIP